MLEKIKEKQLFATLIVGTIIFIVIHLFHTYWGTPASDLFDLEVDNNLPEFFLYLQELGIVIILFMLWRKEENLVYFAWALIFTYVLLDDSLLLHERIGVYLVDVFGVENNFGVRGRDITEVAVQLVFGTPLVGFAAWAHIARGDQTSRQTSMVLFLLLGLLATFAIIIDWFHVKIMIEGSKEIIGTIEDGGEMFIVTGILWYVFRRYRVSEMLFGG